MWRMRRRRWWRRRRRRRIIKGHYKALVYMIFLGVVD
jgi:hypothetical protein